MILKDIDTAFRQDADRTVEHGIDILVQDGEIADIGEGLSGPDVIDCSDQIALPGLINCHSHTPNLLTRGWSDDKSLFPWLDTGNRVMEHADRSDKRAAARLSAALMLETGTTTINDMWNTYLVDELEDIGARALIGSAVADSDDPNSDAIERKIESNSTFIEDYSDHPTVHPTVPAHSVYSCSEELLRAAHDLATTHDIPFHIHVSETEQENEDCIAEHGMTPTAWLDHLGVLDHRTVLAHGVHLTDEDRAKIAASDAGVAHCATSNLKLGSGIADIPSLDGVPVGLGTDGAASNNSLNLFREARTAALVHKRDDPSTITAQRVLDTITCEAAATLGIDDLVGSLEVGKRADIILLDNHDPTLRPYIGDEGLLSNLIYSFRGEVDTTIIEGKVVVEDGMAVTPINGAIETVQSFCTAANERRSDPSRRA